MKNKIALVLFLTTIFNLNFSQENKMTISELRSKIISKIDSVEGDFAVAFRDLSNSGNEIMVNEKETFHAASTMKTPVMIEVFKQSDENKFDLTDSILIKNEFKSIVDSSIFSMDIDRDSGENFYECIEQKKPIIELVKDMITVSGNLTTNILIEIVNAKNITETMRDLGAKDIKVLRGVEDMKAYELGLNNTVTAYDLMLIFKAIAEGEIVSEDVCKQMLDILMQQKFRSKIPALLPEDVKVANKTGSISGVEHDSGIVFLPDGRKYVLVILAKNLLDTEAGIKVEAEISKMIYDFIIEQ
ncbi:MAG: serine hydrolase [Ignavibacteriales bacterium]|nr:serine hydrolase [Ignavibacteriales bacterium]